MVKLAVISGKKMIKILQREGFEIFRIKGSHYFMYNREENKYTTVPVHNNSDLPIGLLNDILRQTGLSAEKYEELRKNL